MRKILAALVLLMLTSCSAMGQAGQMPCFPSSEAMPAEWRPHGDKQRALTTGPWTSNEAADASYAVATGVNEIINLYAQDHTAVEDLWEDAVAALIEVTYADANPPSVSLTATNAARRSLDQLIRPYLARDPQEADCAEYDALLPLAIYAHNHFGPRDIRAQTTLALTNASFNGCGSLVKAMGLDYSKILASGKASVDEAFDLVIWSLLFIEGQLVPGLTLPADAKEMPPQLWDFLRTYPLPDASEYSDGAWNDEFLEVAYLATHIAYIPTGNHRFPIYVEDSPRLYEFHRKNFYAVLQMGELDLVAEFVDSLRQYGCTPENDQQVRDGTRYLLDVFHSGDDRWMSYRETGQMESDVDNYDLVHKAWTAILGVRTHNVELAEPGTYGGVVRSWLPAPE